MPDKIPSSLSKNGQHAHQEFAVDPEFLQVGRLAWLNIASMFPL